MGDAPFQNVEFMEGRAGLDDEDLGNGLLEAQTKALSGGSSKRKDVLSKAWRVRGHMNKAAENTYDLDIGD